MLEIKEQKYDIRFCAKAYAFVCFLGLFALDLWVMFAGADIFVGVSVFNTLKVIFIINAVMLLSVLIMWMIAKWCWNHISYCDKGYETVIRVH